MPRILITLFSLLPIITYAQDRRLAPIRPRKQVALVIGNSAYRNRPLTNPANDARDVGARLKELGFDTDIVLDGGRKQMAAAVDHFLDKLGTGDVALFYYSGHGAQIEGENYLIPVDFEGQNEVDIRYDTHAAGKIQERMERSGAQLNIIVLDACRDNPYRSSSRSSAGGLAAMNAGRGTFVAFATSPGRTASDNSGGRNGLFTQYLLDALRQPGLGLDDIFNVVRERVDESSGGKQLPWTQSAVVGRFTFVAGTPSPPVIAPVDPGPPPTVTGPVISRSPDPAGNKQWADRGEYDLYVATTAEKDPWKRISKVDLWQSHYPGSEFSLEREQIRLAAYGEAERPRMAFQQAAAMLKKWPSGPAALYALYYNVFLLENPGPSELKSVTDLRMKFTAPAGSPVWSYLPRASARAFGWASLRLGDYERAENGLREALSLASSDAQVSYWLASALLGQQKTHPEKQPLALFHFARAAVSEGEGSMKEASRKQVRDYLTRAYQQYHGSSEGLDQLLALAKTNAFPPAEFKIQKTANLTARADAAITDPGLALWRSIVETLQREGGASYFQQNMKDAEFPAGISGVTKLKGAVVSASPPAPALPNIILLAIDDPAGDAVLELNCSLVRRPQAGVVLEFEGVAQSYSTAPLRITFKAECDKLW